MKTFWMLVHREYWEHRMLWITPAVVGALLLLAVIGFGAIRVGTLGGADFGTGRGPLTADVFGFITLAMSMPFYLAAAILAIIYLADCLYAERRDRSILFWRSLPLSDRETVLAKLFTGLVLIPLGCFAAAALTSIGASLIVAVRSALGLLGNVPAWDTAAWLHAKGIELYALVVMVLWYAPYAASGRRPPWRPLGRRRPEHTAVEPAALDRARARGADGVGGDRAAPARRGGLIVGINRQSPYYRLASMERRR